jgi:hypothetical protein
MARFRYPNFSTTNFLRVARNNAWQRETNLHMICVVNLSAIDRRQVLYRVTVFELSSHRGFMRQLVPLNFGSGYTQWDSSMSNYLV